MMMKYFHYISKAKIDMLLAQKQRSMLSSFSITPKIQLGGLSVGGEIKSEASKSVVSDTTKLLRGLVPWGETNS